MKHDVDVSPGFVPLVHHAVYNSSIASSASTSAASVWSDASSQSSDDTAISTTSSDYESGVFSKNLCYDGLTAQPLEQAHSEPVPAELRRNPRRSAPGSHSRGGCPPSLVRQSDRKVNFVDNLVGRFLTTNHATSPRLCLTQYF